LPVTDPILPWPAQSMQNLAQRSLATDNVFSDGRSLQTGHRDRRRDQRDGRDTQRAGVGARPARARGMMAAMSRRWEVTSAVAVVAAAIVMWVLAASTPSLWVYGCERGCSTAARAPGALHVVQLNMLHEFPRFAHLEERVDLIVEELRRLEADVVLLQEVPWTPDTGSLAAELARRTGMNYVYRRANGNRRGILFEEGDAILARFPMRDTASVRLPRGDEFFQNRIAVATTLDTPPGPVRVVTTHLSGEPPHVPAKQIEALRRFARSPAPGMPVVVGGDFNVHPDSPSLVALAGEWTDVLAAADPPDTAPTCCVDALTAMAGDALRDRVDYLWLAGTGPSIVEAHRIFVRATRVEGGWLRASDHVGLFAAIELGR
jgi:endonuclease/exonuclease/phosphatase family metal-dependent hydrolase